MKILALTHRVPFPPDKGEKIRAYHLLKSLSDRGVTVDIITFAASAEEKRYERDLLSFCRHVRMVRTHVQLQRLRGAAFALGRGPLSVGHFHSLRIQKTVRAWMKRTPYDALYCYSSPMAQFAPETGVPRVMDFVDADSDKWRQVAARTHSPLRPLYRTEGRRLARFEHDVAATFDASIFVSHDEIEVLRRDAPALNKVWVVPNGVDTAYFRPRGDLGPAEAPVVVFVGQMDYFPNVDAVTHFCRKVWPSVIARLPQARFVVVGRRPTPRVRALASIPGVHITGSVPDVRPYLNSARVMVAPLRIARGIQNKILEAMAAGVPVIASPAAFAGIEGTAGVHAIIAKTPADFCHAVVRAMTNPRPHAAIASAARDLVEAKYRWAHSVDRLQTVFDDVIRRPASRSVVKRSRLGL